MSSIFLPLIFLPIRLLVPEVASEGRKMGGRKMKSKSSHPFSWDATWNNIEIYCTPGITNAIAEGINGKNRPIKRRTVVYRNFANFKKTTCSTVMDSIPTHSNAGWTATIAFRSSVLQAMALSTTGIHCVYLSSSTARGSKNHEECRRSKTNNTPFSDELAMLSFPFRNLGLPRIFMPT
ncbi:transposase [Pirellulaceae bacterium SH501]